MASLLLLLRAYPPLSRTTLPDLLAMAKEAALSWQDDVSRFQQAILETLGVHVEIDYNRIGSFQRFSTSKKTDKSGLLKVYTSPIVAGAFGDWRTGESHTWNVKARDAMNPTERYQMEYLLQQAKREAQRMRQEGYREASERAWEIWCRAGEPDESHSYLMAKRVRPYCIRQRDKRLVIPLVDTSNNLQSLQFISEDGTKRFLKGGRTRGLFHQVPGKDHIVGVCEGYATAATLYEDTGYTLFIAFNANNLIPVAIHARAMYPMQC